MEEGEPHTAAAASEGRRATLASGGRGQRDAAEPAPFRDGFAQQKHGLAHDLLAILGLPVHPAEPTAMPAHDLFTHSLAPPPPPSHAALEQDPFWRALSHTPLAQALQLGGGTAAPSGARAQRQRQGAAEAAALAAGVVVSSSAEAAGAAQGAPAVQQASRAAPGRERSSGGGLSGYGAGAAADGRSTGATLLLAAALLASEAAAEEAGQRRQREGAVAMLGASYPRALEAARLAAPRLRGLLRGSGGSGGGGGAEEAAGVACAAGQLGLEELHWVGELEMELSSRGRFQALYPLQVRVRGICICFGHLGGAGALLPGVSFGVLRCPAAPQAHGRKWSHDCMLALEGRSAPLCVS